jgi:hypothetical protein
LPKQSGKNISMPNLVIFDDINKIKVSSFKLYFVIHGS